MLGYIDSTPDGEKRTVSQINETANGIRREFLMNQAFNIGGLVAVCCALIVCFPDNIITNLAFIPLAVIYCATKIASGWALYADSIDMNQQTLNLEHTRETRKFLSRLSKSMCDVFGIAHPQIAYSGLSYEGEYDPNSSTIILGVPLGRYLTPSACAVAAHETGHHIQLHDKNAKRMELLVRVARGLKLVPWVVLVVSAAILMLTGISSVRECLIIAAFLYAVGLICQAFYERDATRRAIRFFFTNKELKQNFVKPALKTLQASLRTYYIEAIGWSVFAIVLLVTLMLTATI